MTNTCTTAWDERIIPDETAKGIVAIHLKRYVFAMDRCRSKTVLDVACGTGYGAYHLASVAKQVIGADRSKDAIEYARERYGHANTSFEVMDACALAFPDRTFDVVCSFETIEHVSPLEDYLKEVTRVLKQDGVYFVSTPCAKASTDHPDNPFHVQEWSPHDFRTLLTPYFGSVRLFGQKRRESKLHRILRKLDWRNLHAKIRVPRFTNTLSHLTGTTGFSEMSLDDFNLVEEDFHHADYIVGIGCDPKRVSEKLNRTVEATQ